MHDPVGPSSAWRLNCPGSGEQLRKIFSTTKGDKERKADARQHLRPETEDARKGTELHSRIAALEAVFFDSGKVNIDKGEYYAELDYCSSFLAQQAAEYWDSEHRQVWIERKLEAEIGGEKRWGTPDLVMIWKDYDYVKCRIIDWKFGYRGPEDQQAALQVALYAALVDHNLTDMAVDVYEAYVCGPEIGAIYVPDINIAKAEESWIKLVETYYTDGLPLKTGGWCTYCEALGLCEATSRALLETAASVPATVRPVESWPLERMAHYIKYRKWIRAALDALDKRFRELVEMGAVEGWELRTENGARKVSQPSTFIDRLNEDNVKPHLNVNEVLDETATISVSKFEKMCKRLDLDADGILDGIVSQGTRKVLRERRKKLR